MPDKRRITFLQAALLASLLLHAIGVLGFSLTPPLNAASAETRARTYVVEVVPYRERAPVAAAPSQDAPPSPPPPRGPRVTYDEGYIGVMKKPVPAPPDREPKQQPRRRQETAIDVPASAPPPTTRDNERPQASPSTAASSDPPDPAPTPSPVTVADPVPSPQASPSPSPSPSPSALVQDPRADFSLQLYYHNDERIKAGDDGTLQIDFARLSTLSDVKPVLSFAPKSALPLKDAGRFGLRPMARARATVKVSVDIQQKLPQLVPPSRILVDEVTVDGIVVRGAVRDQLVLFIKDGISNTKWFPASSNGVWAEHSEQSFEVEIIQVSDNSNTAMSPPTSRAP